MALSADKQAMLQLVLERGQSYGDLSSLLGVDEAEVRSRARSALAELGGADPDRNVALTDWLLGQADPIGRADAVRHLKEDPEDHALASELLAKLGDLAPRAQLPKLPSSSRRAPLLAPRAGAAEAARRRPPARKRRTALSPPQLRLIAVLASAAVVLVVVVLGVTGAFGGGDEAATTSTTSSTAGTTTSPTGDRDLQRVPLRSADGGDARGEAVFGIASGTQPFLDLRIENLEPAPNGKAYVVWLLLSEQSGHPLAPFQVGQGNTYSDRIPIGSFLTDVASRTRFVDVSLVSAQGPLQRKIQQAAQQGTPIVPYTGQTVLRGTVPRGGG